MINQDRVYIEIRRWKWKWIGHSEKKSTI